MKRFLSMLLIWGVVLSLAACGGLTEPPEVTSFTEPVTEGPAVVSTVDELLAAIAPGAEIILAEGEFRLDTASDYGERKGPYYVWNDLGLGQYELQIQYVEKLTIRGAGKGKTHLTVDPRWANVLSVVDSSEVTLADMTLGHTEMTEPCEGGVIRLNNVEDISMERLGLYGCGTLGVFANDCREIDMEECEIFECSIGGIQLGRCQEVDIEDCVFHSLGKEMPVSHVFSLWGCSDVEISDNEITNNYVEHLASIQGEQGIVLRRNRVLHNRISGAAFDLQSRGIVLDDNQFEGDQPRNWYSPRSFRALDGTGNELIFEEAEAEVTPPPPGEAVPVTTGEQKNVKVKKVDEFLKAIASDTCITVDAKVLDLSKSASYQKAVTVFEKNPTDDAYYPSENTCYYWRNTYDGPSLVIRNVSNLTIQGKSGDRAKHTISASPRYADVLTFEYCNAVTLSGFTAGHTVEPGQCDGGVFKLQHCDRVLIDNCGMYGCGTEGVFGESSSNIQIVNSEIYECSYNGIVLNWCDNVAISGTIIRDIGDEWYEGAFFSFWDSGNVTLDGVSLDGNYTGN